MKLLRPAQRPIEKNELSLPIESRKGHEISGTFQQRRATKTQKKGTEIQGMLVQIPENEEKQQNKR